MDGLEREMLAAGSGKTAGVDTTGSGNRKSHTEMFWACSQFMKIYVDWANHYLEKMYRREQRAGHVITTLTSDVRDGVILADIIRAVANYDVRHIVRTPTTNQQKLENVINCLSALRQLGINTEDIAAADIVSGNSRSTLVLFFALSHYKQRQVRHKRRHLANHSKPNNNNYHTDFQSSSSDDDKPSDVMSGRLPVAGRHRKRQAAGSAMTSSLTSTRLPVAQTVSGGSGSSISINSNASSGDQFAVTSCGGATAVRVTQLLPASSVAAAFYRKSRVVESGNSSDVSGSRSTLGLEEPVEDEVFTAGTDNQQQQLTAPVTMDSGGKTQQKGRTGKIPVAAVVTSQSNRRHHQEIYENPHATTTTITDPMSRHGGPVNTSRQTAAVHHTARPLTLADWIQHATTADSQLGVANSSPCLPVRRSSARAGAVDSTSIHHAESTSTDCAVNMDNNNKMNSAAKQSRIVSPSVRRPVGRTTSNSAPRCPVVDVTTPIQNGRTSGRQLTDSERDQTAAELSMSSVPRLQRNSKTRRSLPVPRASSVNPDEAQLGSSTSEEVTKNSDGILEFRAEHMHKADRDSGTSSLSSVSSSDIGHVITPDNETTSSGNAEMMTSSGHGQEDGISASDGVQKVNRPSCLPGVITFNVAATEPADAAHDVHTLESLDRGPAESGPAHSTPPDHISSLLRRKQADTIIQRTPTSTSDVVEQSAAAAGEESDRFDVEPMRPLRSPFTFRRSRSGFLQQSSRTPSGSCFPPPGTSGAHASMMTSSLERRLPRGSIAAAAAAGNYCTVDRTLADNTVEDVARYRRCSVSDMSRCHGNGPTTPGNHGTDSEFFGCHGNEMRSFLGNGGVHDDGCFGLSADQRMTRSFNEQARCSTTNFDCPCRDVTDDVSSGYVSDGATSHYVAWRMQQKFQEGMRAAMESMTFGGQLDSSGEPNCRAADTQRLIGSCSERTSPGCNSRQQQQQTATVRSRPGLVAFRVVSPVHDDCPCCPDDAYNHPRHHTVSLDVDDPASAAAAEDCTSYFNSQFERGAADRATLPRVGRRSSDTVNHAGTLLTTSFTTGDRTSTSGGLRRTASGREIKPSTCVDGEELDSLHSAQFCCQFPTAMQQYQQSPSHNPDLPGGSAHRQLPSRCNNNFYAGIKHQNQVPQQQQSTWSSFSPSKSPWNEQSGGSESRMRPTTPSHKSFTLPPHGLLDPRQQQQHYQLMENFIVEDHKVSHEGVDESGGQCVIVSGTTAAAAGGLSKRPPKDAAGSGKEQRGVETNVSSRPRSSEHWTPERGVGGGACRPRTGGMASCRGRGGGSIYSGSLPRLGRTGAANNSSFVTSATLPAPGASGLESGEPVYASSSGPLLSPGLSVAGAAGGGGGGWWKGSSASEPRDSDGSTTSSGAAATKKEEDVHGSMLSLISNTSSVFSTPEEKQMQEVRKLKRELDAAHEKISTLSAQLSTNVHVVTAFEQSLANMTHRLQKLTVASERKDAELNDLRAALQSLQYPGSHHTPQDFHHQQQHGMTSQPGSCGSTPRHIRSAQLSLTSNNATETSHESPSQQTLQVQQQQQQLPTSSDSDLSMSSHSSVNSNTAQQQNTPSSAAAAAAAAAAADKKRTSWLSSSFRKAFSRRKSKQHCSFDSESPGGGTADDTIVTSCGGRALPTTSLPTSPLLPCGGSARTHSSIPCTPVNAPRRMSASTLENGVDDIEDHLSSEQLVVVLNEQLHEKDMKLTDVRLEALSSAHQLEQLREMLSQMKVEMLQLKADNERMQRTITRNGLKEQLLETAEDRSPAFRKKLSLGGPTTFDTIALETSNKDSQRFVVYVQLQHNVECNTTTTKTTTTTTATEQDSAVLHRLLVGSIALTSKTRWSELDEIVSQTFLDYVNRVDPGSGLGLNEDSILDYDVGDIKRTKGAKPPELLPCGYLVGANRDVIVRLRGVEESEVDLLAFETLIPKSIVERYVSLLLEHRRLILCGPSGTGKTFLAHRLAEYVQHRSGQRFQLGAVATFTVDQKSSRELRQYLSNVADQCSAAGDVTTSEVSCDSSRATAAPTVIVVDNLHHVASLGDAFGRFLGDGQQQRLNKSPYIIGTMRQTTSSTSADLQLTHHNFRWVLFANHTEPVRGLLARCLQRQLIAAEARHHGVTGAELDRVVTWLPKAWNHVNRFLTTHCSAEVTLGPRLFLSCPMDAAASCLWFADLWNYSIVPYLLEALRETKQPQPSARDVTWEDPVEWVASHLPWSDSNASPGGCRGDMPSLLRLRPDDAGNTNDADVNCAASASCRPSAATVEHRTVTSRPSSNDPLMTMLLRLQEVTMCSSVYGGDGLELELTDSRSNKHNQAAFV